MMPEHVRAKNLGLVKPMPVLEAPHYGRLQIDKTLNGGLLFKIIVSKGTYGVELSPRQAAEVGYKILYALGHHPVMPPDVDVERPA